MQEEVFSDLYVSKFYSLNHFYSHTGVGNVRKNRNSWAVAFKYEGETEYKVRKTKIKSDSHNLAIIPRGSSYSWECKQGGHCYIIEFDTNKTYEKILSFPFEDTNKITDIFKKIEQEIKPDNTYNNLKIMELIYKILFMLTDEQTRDRSKDQKKTIILPAINYIFNHYTESIDNNFLSSLCYISNSYFRKLFLQCYGVPPIQYITKLRIEKAKELLCTDYTSVGDVAAEVGYENIYHFSKVFKAQTGFSPLNYVKNKFKKNPLKNRIID